MYNRTAVRFSSTVTRDNDCTMVEVVVFGAAILCGAAGLAAASSSHRERKESLDDRPVQTVDPNRQHRRSNDGYDFWDATLKGGEWSGDRNRVPPDQNLKRKSYQNPDYPYEFWNTVDKQVPPSYGINVPQGKQAGPFYRSN